MKKSNAAISQGDTKKSGNINDRMRLAVDLLKTSPAESNEIVNALLSNDPENPLLWVISCRANQWLGNIYLAEKSIDTALTLRPGYVEALYTKSDLLYRNDRFDEAESFITRAINGIGNTESRPLRALYGTILQKQKKFEEAEVIFKALVKEVPDYWLYWNNLGMIMQDLSRFDEMDTYYRESCQHVVENPTAFFNMIVGSHYNPARSAQDILAMCKEWQEKFKPDNPVVRISAADKTKSKRLRIGMISDGFRSHPVGNMITVGLSHVPEAHIEFYAYSTNNKEDHVTHRIQQLCGKWQVIEHISPVALAEIIREDEIDILFDLCGYNSNSRMQTMQLAPAPVQVKWVGGLISSTGLETIDYLLSDAVQTPPGIDDLYTEKLIRLPGDYICYDPPFYLPELNSLPARKNGFITFGCFNNASKINDEILEKWAVILTLIPDSHLFLKSFNFKFPSLKENIYSKMEAWGIARERLRIEGSSPHEELLRSYHDVDIALDPWPYSGGLTTCEAMVMGVPAVTMPGPTFAGRHSATHLVHAGMPELVAEDWQNYVRICVELASDLDSLSVIRKNLRYILMSSPVCDGKYFAQHFSDAMRAIWQRHCDGLSPEALTLSDSALPQFAGESSGIQLEHPATKVTRSKAEVKAEFQFNLAGKVSMLDYGGRLTVTGSVKSLSAIDATYNIIMDPVGLVEEKHLPLRRRNIQHIKLHALGDGSNVPFYLCLDPLLSSDLKPLENSHDQGGVVTEITVPSSRLDAIHGLDSLDWLILDNTFNLQPVFEHGREILSGCLVIDVKVSFSPTHEGQLSFGEIAQQLADCGFVFHAFKNFTYGGTNQGDVKNALASSRLSACNAIFLPTYDKRVQLDNSRREKLAFVMHIAYEMKDVSCQLIRMSSEERANEYQSIVLQTTAAQVSAMDAASPVNIPQPVKPIKPASIIPEMPRMSEDEARLFEDFIKQSTRYFEFGSGGSTKLAVRNNIEVFGVESDKRWVDTLKSETGELCKVDFVDIGPTKEWGYPVDNQNRAKFPDYSEAILHHDQPFDLILVDGRFRVACTLNTIKHTLKHKHAADTTYIFIHDFWNRPDYHIVLNYLDVVKQIDSAGVFTIKKGLDMDSLNQLIDKYKFIPS